MVLKHNYGTQCLNNPTYQKSCMCNKLIDIEAFNFYFAIHVLQESSTRTSYVGYILGLFKILQCAASPCKATHSSVDVSTDHLSHPQVASCCKCKR